MLPSSWVAQLGWHSFTEQGIYNTGDSSEMEHRIQNLQS